MHLQISDGLAVLVAGVFGLIALALAFVGYIVSAFLLMRVFDKAGVQGRWRAWVPVYNTLVLSKLGDVSPWVTLGAIVLALIPYLNFVSWVALVVVGVMVGWRVGLKLGKNWPLLLLWLIPSLGHIIWLAVLAFSGERWNTAVRPAPWGGSFLADTTRWSGIPDQVAIGGGPYGTPGPASR